MKEIQLTRGFNALIDDRDYKELNQYSWRVAPNRLTYYAHRSSLVHEGKKRITVSMHHQIIGKPPKGLMTDHIDGNGLNNQRNNLRFVTPRENCQNMFITKTSKYPGVCWDKRGKKWVAYIGSRETKRHLGRFVSEEEAYKAYQKAVQEVENPFALLSMNDLLTKIEKLKQKELRING